jgi:hypothetical protein
MSVVIELWDPSQTAAAINVTAGTLAVWRCTKRYALRYVRVGRKIRYRPQDVEAFLASRTVAGDGGKSQHKPKPRR